jgi:hypothetical protein
MDNQNKSKIVPQGLVVAMRWSHFVVLVEWFLALRFLGFVSFFHLIS